MNSEDDEEKRENMKGHGTVFILQQKSNSLSSKSTLMFTITMRESSGTAIECLESALPLSRFVIWLR